MRNISDSLLNFAAKIIELGRKLIKKIKNKLFNNEISLLLPFDFCLLSFGFNITCNHKIAVTPRVLGGFNSNCNI